MIDGVLIDSNILAYVFDQTEPEKQQVCKELIESCWDKNQKFVVSTQNLSEFYVTVTHKFENPVPKKTAKKFITDMIKFRNWKVISFDMNTVLSAIDINTKYGVHYWDAVLAATMKEHGVFSIYTEDRHFSKIRWIETINPMKRARR